MKLQSYPLSRGYAPVWASAWGQDEYGSWCAFCIRDVEQCLRWIPPGTFLMGSPDDGSYHLEQEMPQHQVRLSQGFWLFDTPCTQALWEAVMEENPSYFQGARRPVESVNWEDCQRFIGKLNDICPELALGLPTEAQWEYACRAGTQEERYDADVNAIAWYDVNCGNETHEVGQKRANDWGLYDMLGNVWEWCHDGKRDYEPGLVIDPMGPTEGGAKGVFRGGSWYYSAQYVQAAYRYVDEPDLRDSFLGFRCLSSDREPGSGGA